MKKSEGKEEWSFWRDFVYPIVQWSLMLLLIITILGETARVCIVYGCDIFSNVELFSKVYCGIVLAAAATVMAFVMAPNPPRWK